MFFVIFQKSKFSHLKKTRPYKNPKNDYECFIERYCLREKSRLKASFTKQKAVERGQTEWKGLKRDSEVIQEILKLLPGVQPSIEYDEDGFETDSNRVVRESSSSSSGYFRQL